MDRFSNLLPHSITCFPISLIRFRYTMRSIVSSFPACKRGFFIILALGLLFQTLILNYALAGSSELRNILPADPNIDAPVDAEADTVAFVYVEIDADAPVDFEADTDVDAYADAYADAYSDADAYLDVEADVDAYVLVQPKNDTTSTYKVVTRDGRTTIGRLIRQDETSVTLDVEDFGEVTIWRENIRSISEMDEKDFVDGTYRFPNPISTRYLFAPNAIPMKRKSYYYQNTWIFFNNFNYGFTNRFSLGAGTVPIFLFGVNALPIWLLPKYSLPLATDQFHLSLGGVIGGVIGGGSDGGGLAGLLYGTATVGNRNNNISLGVGFGYVDDGFSGRPVINISGMRRLSSRGYLITENYIFSVESGSEALISAGYRYAAESFAVDFALVRPVGATDGFIGIPWLGVTLPFRSN